MVSGSVHVGYGALLARELDDDDDDDDDGGGDDGDGLFDGDGDGEAPWMARQGTRAARRVRDLWLSPKQGAVRKVVDRWWSRWAVLVVLPAMLVGFSSPRRCLVVVIVAGIFRSVC